MLARRFSLQQQSWMPRAHQEMRFFDLRAAVDEYIWQPSGDAEKGRDCHAVLSLMPHELATGSS